MSQEIIISNMSDALGLNPIFRRQADKSYSTAISITQINILTMVPVLGLIRSHKGYDHRDVKVPVKSFL